MLQKAVLNRNNHREYVLVYNEGSVYYSFHKSFVPAFKKVIEEWSAGMRKCERFPEHVATFPSEGQSDDIDDGGIKPAFNKLAIENDSDDDGLGARREKGAGKRSNRYRTSSQSQSMHTISPPHSHTSSTSDRTEPAGLHRLSTSSDNLAPISDYSLPRSASTLQSGIVRRHSSKTS